MKYAVIFQTVRNCQPISNSQHRIGYRILARTGLLVGLTLAAAAAGSSEQSGSLKDAARRHGGTLYDYLQVEMPAAPLSEVVSAADVILRARITSQESRLTEDERFVRTYVRVQRSASNPRRAGR